MPRILFTSICTALDYLQNIIFIFKHFVSFKHDMKVSYTLLYVRLSHSRSHIKSFLHYKTLFCVSSISLSIFRKMIYGKVVIYLIYTEYLNDWKTLFYMLLFFYYHLDYTFYYDKKSNEDISVILLNTKVIIKFVVTVI